MTSPTTAADCGTGNNPAATADADDDPVTDSGTRNVQCPGLNVAKVADPATMDAGEAAAFESWSGTPDLGPPRASRWKISFQATSTGTAEPDWSISRTC